MQGHYAKPGTSASHPLHLMLNPGLYAFDSLFLGERISHVFPDTLNFLFPVQYFLTRCLYSSVHPAKGVMQAPTASQTILILMVLVVLDLGFTGAVF